MKVHTRWLNPYYDKLLHVTVTFALVLWLAKIMPLRYALLATFALQVLRTVQNYLANPHHRPYGDWAANLGGYILSLLFLSA